jgi:hypothetical protein
MDDTNCEVPRGTFPDNPVPKLIRSGDDATAALLKGRSPLNPARALLRECFLCGCTAGFRGPKGYNALSLPFRSEANKAKARNSKSPD